MSLPVGLRPFAPNPEAVLPTAQTPIPGQWSFWCDRTVGAIPLGPVAPTAFSYSTTLSGFGNGTVTLPVDTVPLSRDDLLNLWSWRLWAFYDGAPMWCGCPTGVTDEGRATVEVTLTELAGYLTRRQFDTTRNYVQQEQTYIASQIAGPVTAVGVVIVTEPGSGFKRDRSYEYLEGESRAELLTNLSQVISGPEFRSEYGIDPTTGAMTATLRIAYPRVGSSASNLGIVVPGGALEYSGAWDADLFRTHTFAVGDLPENAAENAVQPVVVVDRPIAGLPRLDSVDEWPGTILVSTLTERANTAATIYARPTYDVSASTFESSPPLGSYGLGDDVTVNIITPLLPDGLVTTGRLVGLSADAVTGKVDWTVSATVPPARPRATLSGRLARLDSARYAMFVKSPQEVT